MTDIWREKIIGRKICFSDFSKMAFFQKINLFEKNIFFVIKFGIKIFPKNATTSAI